MDVSTPGELELAASVAVEARFHRLLWSEYSSVSSRNLLIGGAENSKVYLYDAARLERGPVSTLEQHVGPVYALDVNPFQHNLLASGASASEILVWDLNNPKNPMTPG